MVYIIIKNIFYIDIFIKLLPKISIKRLIQKIFKDKKIFKNKFILYKYHRNKFKFDLKKKKKLNKKIINEIKHIKNMKFILSKNINFFYGNILSKFKI